jgi:hypothetical protein
VCGQRRFHELEAALALWAGAASRYDPAVTVSKARLCLAALSVALLAGACSASDDLSGAKAAYVAQVDPICAELQDKIGQLGENAEQQAADVEAAVMKMKAAAAPRDDKSIADLHIAAMENLYLSLQDVHQSRLVNDQPRADRALEGARANNKRAADAAESYGMVACAQEL